MASAAVIERSARRRADPTFVRAYCWCVTAVFVGALPLVASAGPFSRSVNELELVGWIALIGIADMLRVRLWDEFSFAMSLPVSLAAVALLDPWQAGLVASLGSLDTREIRAEVPLSRALFNRAEVGASVLFAALAFRLLGGQSSWPDFLLPLMVAGVIDLATNTALVAPAVAGLHGSSIREVLHRAFGPAPAQFATVYLALWLLGPLTVVAYLEAGLAGVALVVAPAVAARLALVQTVRAAEVEEHLESKKQALATATDRASQERRDERRMLAGELHDEVLPALYKVHLMGQVLRKDLEQGRLLDLEADVPELASATEAAQVAIRRVMNDLRQSSLGRNGLVATLKLLARTLEASSNARFSMTLEPLVGVDHLSQLVLYQVAREAMTNAARYSHTTEIEVRLSFQDGDVRLVVSDHGVGFAVDAVESGEHFGLQLMRERVESVGGSLVIDSRIGAGTTIVASVPATAMP